MTDQHAADRQDLVQRLRSRAWEDRQHRVLRSEAANTIESLSRELSAAKADIAEWLCDKCRTVFPPPTGVNLNCPQCNGCLRPSSVTQRRLEADIAAKDAQVERLRDALRELVACKDLKDRVNADRRPDANYVKEIQDYTTRKPLAWAAARALVQEGGKS